MFRLNKIVNGTLALFLAAEMLNENQNSILEISKELSHGKGADFFCSVLGMRGWGKS